MKNTMLDSIKLVLPSNHLLNKLAKHIKQNNRSKSLKDIISRFIWLEYNNRNWLLELSGPILQQWICTGQKENVYSIGIVDKNKLEIPSSNIVRTWSKNINAGLKYLLYLQYWKWHSRTSGLDKDLIYNREINKVISCSTIRLVEGTS